MIALGFPTAMLPTGYINMVTPQQTDAVSCGVFVLQTIRSLIKAIPLMSSVEAIEHIQGWGPGCGTSSLSDARQQLVELILGGD
jgi:hypothetical protein